MQLETSQNFEAELRRDPHRCSPRYELQKYMDQLSDFLKVKGINGKHEEIARKIFSLPFNKLIDLTEQTFDMGSKYAELEKIKPSLFNFSASSSLSGVAYCCPALDCRVRSIDKISLFASMYADTIFIPNFLRKIPPDINIQSSKQKNWLYQAVVNDFVAFLKFEPLLREGIIRINPYGTHYCPKCKAEYMGKLIRHVSQNLKDEIYFSIIEKGVIELVQKQNYVDGTISDISMTGALKNISEFPYRLTDQEVNDLKLLEETFGPILEDVLEQKNPINELGFSYLTNRGIDTEILGLMNKEKEKNLNKILLEGLSHLLPYIQGVSIQEVLEIRNKDGSAFIQYRDAFKRTIKQTAQVTSSIEVGEAVQDIIIPEVNKIQRLLDINKERFSKKAKRSLIFDAITITAGLVGQHFLNMDANVVNSIAGVKTVHDVYNLHSESKEEPKEVKENSYYFLWQIVKRSETKRN